MVLADTNSTEKGANEVMWRSKHGGQCDETPSRVSSPDSTYSTASSTASRVTTRVNSPEGVLDGFKFGCAGVPISPFSSRPQTTTRTSALKSTASNCAGSSPSDNLITCGTAACASTSEADVRSSSSSLPTIRSHRWGGPLRPCALSRATGCASASVHEGADNNNNNNNNNSNSNQQQRQQKKKQQREEDDTLSKACGRERALRAEIACIQAQVQR